MAKRNSLPGVGGLILERFNQCCNQGNFSEAAKIAVNSPEVYTNDMHIFNAVAKIYIDTNNNAKHFLKENLVYFP